MRNRYVLFLDIVAVALAAFGAFTLRFDWLFTEYRPLFTPYLIAALVLKPIIFLSFGLYRRYWRYASVSDVLALVLAVSFAGFAMAAFVIAGLYVHLFWWYSRSIPMIDALLTLAFMTAIRLSIRIVGETRSGHTVEEGRRARRIIVAGAGDAGTLMVREMQRNPGLRMVPVGFVDDASVKHRKRIYGVPVLGATDSIEVAVRQYHADEVVIAMPAAPGKTVRGIAEACTKAGIAFRTMPGVFELLDGNVSVSRLRQVDIVDLLRRNPVSAAVGGGSYLTGRTVLVTGAGGSIGLELCRHVAHARPACLVLVGHGENSIYDGESQLREAFPEVRVVSFIADVRDAGRLNRILSTVRPAVVFHAAAHKHVPLMETNPEEAITNNVFGTMNVLDAARLCGAQRLVMISSDKAVAPTSIMGASKRLAELLVRDAARRHDRAFMVVRFGNVLGSRGSVVPTFKRQIERGGPITITHPDMKRFFMTISEAVHLVVQAGGLGTGGELFVLNMGEPVRIVDLATDMIKLSGLTPADIPVVVTGTRPGEKLTEALWEDRALIEHTDHPEVLRVTERDATRVLDVATLTAELRDAVDRGDRGSIEAVLAREIPTGERLTTTRANHLAV